MGRHGHITCVRSDGLSAVLRPLLDDRRIVAATLVDAGSGLVLDGYADDPALADLELVGAVHADMVRAAATLAGRDDPPELTVDTGDGRHHVLQAVPDPHGERLVVAVVVQGTAWHVARARRRLRTVSVAALTDGPSTRLRPVDGAWLPETTPIPTAGAGADAAEAPDLEAIPDPRSGSGDAAPPASMVPRATPT